jgi:hypothetical protein
MILHKIDTIDSDIMQESDEDYPDAVHLYDETINNLMGQFQIFSRIAGDYSRYHALTGLDIDQFVKNNWKSYLDLLSNHDLSERTKMFVIKFLINKVLNTYQTIDGVCKELDI